MRGGLGDMMKQVQQMQAKMAALQEELENTELEASSGGGMVKVVMNGKNVVRSITIDREVVDPEDVEMLQDLIVAAVNEGVRKSQELASSEMAKITGGMGIPGLGM